MTNTKYDNIYQLDVEDSLEELYLQDWHDGKLTIDTNGYGSRIANHTQVLDMIDAMQKYMRGVIEKMRGWRVRVRSGYLGLDDDFSYVVGELYADNRVELIILDENNEIDGMNLETMRTVIEWRNAWINEHGE